MKVCAVQSRVSAIGCSPHEPPLSWHPPQFQPIWPLVFSQNVNIVSSRVTNYTWSAFDSQTAFDQVALVAGSD
jgi:hypothetical protein